MKSNFLLKSGLALKLYEACASLPLIDWHNHLSVNDLVSDRKFENMTELWITSDPYKHRAMRICGVPEEKITGNSSDYEKFLAWSGTVPKLPGNPLYHWSMLELKRVFGLDCELNMETARNVWSHANTLIAQNDFSARALLGRFNVEYASPCMKLTENPQILSGIGNIVPSLRGDDLTAPSLKFLSELEKAAGISISSFADFTDAVSLRLDSFHAAGCRFADHALDGGFQWIGKIEDKEALFSSFLNNDAVEKEALESLILTMLAGEYAKRSWTLQLHIGAERNTSTRLRGIAGKAGGYAAISHPVDIKSLTRMFDALESAPYGLPRMILYTLNPADNAALAVLSGSYPGDGVSGKVQLGPAWWFCDHIYGMRECFENTASYGVLSTFVGMTTDSRSFLSFARHEYFRRVFCNWLAEKALNDELPDDFEILRSITENIFYNNAKKLL